MEGKEKKCILTLASKREELINSLLPGCNGNVSKGAELFLLFQYIDDITVDEEQEICKGMMKKQ